MSNWFDYNIRFANKNENLAEAMVKKGLATIKENEQSLQLDLKKINPIVFESGYKENDAVKYLSIGINGNDIYYTNKWEPDDRLVSAISKCFPDDVFDISRIYTGGFSHYTWYEKNGQTTLKNGNPVTGFLFEVNPKLVKETENTYQVSLPIGEENDKWGTISISKDNLKCFYRDRNGIKSMYGISVFFETESVNVAFKNSIVTIPVKALESKYYESKQNYREDMQSLVEITGLNRTHFRRKNDYYIVKIPCPRDVSYDGYISITLSNYDVNENIGTICLGRKGYSRNVQIVSQDGVIIRDRFSHPYIKECFDKAAPNARTKKSG